MEQLPLTNLSAKTSGAPWAGAPILSTTKGHVEEVLHFNEESGDCILDVRLDPDQVPHLLKARLAAVYPGQEFETQLIPLSTSGSQEPQQVQWIKLHEPSSPRSLKKFLRSRAFTGIPPNTIKLLAKNFAGRLSHTLDLAPGKILEIPGIGPKRQAEILKSWHDHLKNQELREFLFRENLPLTWAQILWTAHGRGSVDFLKNHPYDAIEQLHLPFDRVDTFALKSGYQMGSIERLRSGLLDLLRAHGQQGHCAFPENALLEEGLTRLQVPRPALEEALELELIEGHIVADGIGETPCLFPKELWDLERQVAKKLMTFQGRPPAWGGFNAGKVLSWAQEILEIELAPKQKEAIETALSSPLSVITGGPGTGKTMLTQSLVKILQLQFTRFALCSPTGRAAQRLSEATAMPTKTIHRLLHFDGFTSHFGYNTGRQLDLELVLIDEASMLDLTLFDHLLDALPPHCNLILIGDADQLPSIGAGTVLQSIIASRLFPVVTLTDSFRQSESSLIHINAKRINAGQMPLNVDGKDFHYISVSNSREAKEIVQDLFTRVLPEQYGIHDPADIQILTPMNRGPLGSQQLNEDLRQRLRQKNEFLSGVEFGQHFRLYDKVMAIKNDYRKYIFNGDVGFVAHIDHRLRLLTVNFGDRQVDFEFDELDRLTLAYAISIHKAQGSEYRAVIVLLTHEHLPLAQRHLIYTAITRGKECVFLVAEPSALEQAIQTSEHRWQKLSERLMTRNVA